MSVSRGFTLTELLVALLIGSVVVLAAGQLLVAALRAYQQVDRLGRQQAALIYTVTTVADQLRVNGSVDGDGQPRYLLVCEQRESQCHCTVQDTQAAQPLLTFAAPATAGCRREQPLGERLDGRGRMAVTLPLGPGGQEVRLTVSHRETVLREAFE